MTKAVACVVVEALVNVARLVENRDLYHGVRNRGSAREGRSLLQGIVLCGRCGRHMNVSYRSDGLTH